jgi:hypothetical protein
MPDDPKPNERSAWLGVFVLFQAIFLPLANLTQLIPREAPPQKGELDVPVPTEGTATSIRPLQEAINGLGAAFDRYGEFSGQTQYWSLFASMETASPFPLIEFETIRGHSASRNYFPSEHVPRNLDRYTRSPGPECRLWAYEYLLTAVFANCTKPSLENDKELWRRVIAERVRRQQRSLTAYFEYQMALPRNKVRNVPAPTSIILSVSIYPAPEPGQTDHPERFAVKLARWQPELPAGPDYLPIEAYDPVTERFVRLPVKEGEQ